MVIIAGIGTTPDSLVARPEINSIEDLRGKTFGTNRIGGTTDFAILELLPKLGLVPRKDMKLLSTGLTNPEQRTLLMRQGIIEATLSVPDVILRMVQLGYKVNNLADLVERGIYTSGGDLISSPLSQRTPRHRREFLESAQRSDLARQDQEGSRA